MRVTLHQQKRKVQENVDQIMCMYVSQKHIMFEPDASQTMISSKLLIDRSSHKLKELKPTDRVQDTNMKMTHIYGVLGLIKIFGKIAVLYIEDADLVCLIQEAPIFHIKKVGLMLLDTKENDEMLDIQEKEFIQQLTRILQSSFYFSYQYDLTQHTQAKNQQTISQSVQPNQVKSNHMRYWWNHNLLKNFHRDGIADNWHLKIIQGYVSSFHSTFKNNKQLQFFIVSRIQYHRSGNFSNHKGINEEGQTANHVETEQIILYDTFKSSYVIVRGSIPLYWNRAPLSKQITLTNDDEHQRKAYHKHINNLLACYSKVACINLLGKKKGLEAHLSQTFEKYIFLIYRFNNSLQFDNKIENVGYEQLDFDEVCKDYKFENLNHYLDKMNPIITYFRYFIQDKANKPKLQKGVFRLNCLDCLDRTNIYMTKIALKVVQDIMEEMGIATEQEFNCTSLVQQADLPSLQNQHPFLVYFKQQWSDNGDQITKHYKSHINISDLMTNSEKGIEQYYKMNLDDNYKQDVVDQMLGMNVQTSTSLDNIKTLENMLKSREQEYLKNKQVSVYVVTWNINAHIPNNLLTNDFASLFDMRSNESPDLIAVAFQELVTLNAMNVVGNNNQIQIDSWRKIIELTVQKQIGDYVIVATSDMVGCLLLILVKKDLQGKITNIETDAVKCGFKSQLGNKGGVIIKMSFYDSVVCFINCHLPAGQKKAEARLQAIQDIHEKAFQQDKINPDNNIKKFDWIIFTGDTNFRINLPYTTAVEYMNKYNQAQKNNMQNSMNNILSLLRENDQLKLEQHKSHYLKQYTEANIDFLPTYKYDIGTDAFDTSKKQRVPSWTDRVMFCSQSIHLFTSLFYDKLQGPFQISDHRPVGCYIQTSVSQVQDTNKDKVFQEILMSCHDEDHQWSQKYFDKSPLIHGRNPTILIFDQSPRKLNKKINFLNATMGDSNIEDDQFTHSRSQPKSRAGGRRPIPDLEELTNPFNE